MTQDIRIPDIRPAAFWAFWMLIASGASVALVVALFGVLNR